MTYLRVNVHKKLKLTGQNVNYKGQFPIHALFLSLMIQPTAVTLLKSNTFGRSQPRGF